MQIPNNAKYIIQTLKSTGHKAYVVGGCVRDSILAQNSLLRKEPHDWDICTSALPEQVLAIFSAHKVIETGLKHGTVTVLLDGEGYEVTTFRIDGEYSDSRRPDGVTFTHSVEEDLARRDFTINAMAYDKETLVDPFSGEQDIKNWTIRCVGNPYERFNEDPLRILRALRFAATLNFVIEDETEKAMFQAKERLNDISVERIQTELVKLLLSDNFTAVTATLLDYKEILAVFMPEIAPSFNFNQNNRYHIYDVWKHIAVSVSHGDADKYVCLALLFHDIGKPACYSEDEKGGHFHGHPAVSATLADDIMRRLKFDNETSALVRELVFYHDYPFTASPRFVRKMLNRLGEAQFRRLISIRKADLLAHNPEHTGPRLEKTENTRLILEEVLATEQCFSLKDLAVNGRDLIDLGYTPGPALGKKLNELLQIVLDDPTQNIRKELLVHCTK